MENRWLSSASREAWPAANSSANPGAGCTGTAQVLDGLQGPDVDTASAFDVDLAAQLLDPVQGMPIEKSSCLAPSNQFCPVKEDTVTNVDAAEEKAAKSSNGKRTRANASSIAPENVIDEDGAPFEGGEVADENVLRKHAQWMSMFGIQVEANRERKPECDLMSEAAAAIAKQCLRDKVTLPCHPTDASTSWTDLDSGGNLPAVSCAFLGCRWCGSESASCDAEYYDDCEHPWDQELRHHVITTHGATICGVTAPYIEKNRMEELMWDLYKEALSVQERQQIPSVGYSVERRTFKYATHVYNDNRIRSLICFACAQIKVDTGRIRSAIEYRSGRWLFSLPKGSLTKKFSMAEFEKIYRQMFHWQ